MGTMTTSERALSCAVGLALAAGCGHGSSGATAGASNAATAPSQHAVLPDATPLEAASFEQMVGELGIDIGPDVPPADAEALQRLMSHSGFQIKAIRCVAPAKYTIDVWGAIPHAASEFTLERHDEGWKIVGDTPWVLIG
jgi:ABC-type nitrate/sulfonate/bicarbonate transport system substrate-binding protein